MLWSNDPEPSHRSPPPRLLPWPLVDSQCPPIENSGSVSFPTVPVQRQGHGNSPRYFLPYGWQSLNGNMRWTVSGNGIRKDIRAGRFWVSASLCRHNGGREI